MDSAPVGSAEAMRLVKESITRWLLSQAVVVAPTATVTLPAAPAMIDEYVAICAALCAQLGRDLSDDDRARIRPRLQRRLAEAHATSPHSTITVALAAAGDRPVRYHIIANRRTTQRSYTHWLNTRKPPLFGGQPDARVWALATEAADPGTHRVLDIGAGTGRNALPLARRGHPVDAVELTEKFADVIRADAERESLDVRVLVGDVFSAFDELRRDYQLILLSGVVSDFGSTQQLRGLFDLAGQRLDHGARLVFNAFLTRGGYALDQAGREFGQHFHTGSFTRDEMHSAAAEFPLELVADDAVYDYEKAHLPDGAWPPTGWYADWVRGLNPFPVDPAICPVEMRWLVYQKTG